MNRFEAYIKPKAVGYWGMIRLARNGEAQPLKEKGKPIYFEDAFKAQKAVTDHLLRYFNGRLCGEFEPMQKSHVEIERVFGSR